MTSHIEEPFHSAGPSVFDHRTLHGLAPYETRFTISEVQACIARDIVAFRQKGATDELKRHLALGSLETLRRLSGSPLEKLEALDEERVADLAEMVTETGLDTRSPYEHQCKLAGMAIQFEEGLELSRNAQETSLTS